MYVMFFFQFSFIKERKQLPQHANQNLTQLLGFLHLQGRWEGGSEVLHQSILLLWPLEREDAAGHRGQEEGEAETEGMCAQAQAQGPGNVQYSALPYYAAIEVIVMNSGAVSTWTQRLTSEQKTSCVLHRYRFTCPARTNWQADSLIDSWAWLHTTYSNALISRHSDINQPFLHSALEVITCAIVTCN